MTYLLSLGPALSFALACNLDTLLLAAAVRGRGPHLTWIEGLILAAVTTVVTGTSLAVGKTAAALWTLGSAERLGGLVLLAVGLWCLLDALRGTAEPEETPQGNQLWAWCALAAALAVNNAAAGGAAGAAGLDVHWGMGCNFVVTLLTLVLGGKLAGRLRQSWLLPLGGLLLAGLGLWEIWMA